METTFARYTREGNERGCWLELIPCKNTAG